MSILNKFSKLSWGLALGLTAGIFAACTPDDGEQELGPKPSASFTITPIAGKTNTYLATSTSTGGTFQYLWDPGDGSDPVLKVGTDTIHLYYSRKGDCTVKLTALGSGGHGKAANTVAVAENDCKGAMTLLSGCDSKTWVLAPEAGALHIGPPEGGTWWGSSEADVTDSKRTCLFNDEYTFTRDFELIIDDKGDIRVDDEAGKPWPADMGPEIGCYSMDQIPDKYKAWGSGTHAYQVSGSSLKLSGLGAHMGLYKVGDAGGNIPGPAESVTYKIMELTEDKLVIEKRYEWGVWTFTFRPKA